MKTKRQIAVLQDPLDELLPVIRHNKCEVLVALTGEAFQELVLYSGVSTAVEFTETDTNQQLTHSHRMSRGVPFTAASAIDMVSTAWIRRYTVQPLVYDA